MPKNKKRNRPRKAKSSREKVIKTTNDGGLSDQELRNVSGGVAKLGGSNTIGGTGTPQLRGRNANFALVATASAFLAVGFSRPSAQAHDELKSEFIVAT